MTSGYQIRSAPKTHKGKRRPINQDFVTLYEPASIQDLQTRGCLYVVADGVGKGFEGERASKYAARKLLSEYYQLERADPASSLQCIIRQIGNDLHEYAARQNTDAPMATTLVAAIVRGETLTVANVGDSRAYLIRQGTARQITHDHNQLAEMVRDGQITQEESRRIKGKNKLTRSLGGERDVLVDVYVDIPLEEGDRILLCSDGLTRYVIDPQDLLQNTSYETPEEVVDHLIGFANDCGGADNISALLIDIGPLVDVSEILTAREVMPIEAVESIQEAPTEYYEPQENTKKHAFSFLHKPYPPRFEMAVLAGMFLVILICSVRGGLWMFSSITQEKEKNEGEKATAPSASIDANIAFEKTITQKAFSNSMPDTATPTLTPTTTSTVTPTSTPTILSLTDTPMPSVDPNIIPDNYWCVYILPKEMTISEVIERSTTGKQIGKYSDLVFEATGGSFWKTPYPNGLSENIPETAELALSYIITKNRCNEISGVVKEKPISIQITPSPSTIIINQ